MNFFYKLKQYFIYLKKKKQIRYVRENLLPNCPVRFFVLYYNGEKEEFPLTSDRYCPEWIKYYQQNCGYAVFHERFKDERVITYYIEYFYARKGIIKCLIG